MTQGRTKKLITETAWFAVGNFGSKILSLLLVPLYTNILSTSEYGTIDILTTTIALAVPILTLSVYDAAFRYVMDRNYDSKTILSNAVLIIALSPLLLFLLYPLLGAVLPEVTKYWWYFIAIYVLNSFSTSISYYLKGVDKTNIFALQGIIHTFVYAGLNVLFLAVLHLRIEGYFISQIIAYFVAVVFMFIAGGLYKDVSLKYLDRNILKEMLKYSLPLIPASVAWWIMTSIDKYMLLYMCGSSANGLYGIAQKIPTIISTLT